MESFLKKNIDLIFWVIVVIDCLMQYFEWHYTYFTEPVLVPLLILKMFLQDDDIGSPLPKFFFYIGLFFSFFGDVLQLVVTNTLFFYSSIIAYTIMNFCYAVSIIGLNGKQVLPPRRILWGLPVLAILAFAFFYFMGNELGVFKAPLIGYVFMLVVVSLAALSLLTNTLYRSVAIRYFIPAIAIEIIQNFLFALNLFHLTGSAQGYAPSLALYAISQYLMSAGILKAYIHEPQKN